MKTASYTELTGEDRLVARIERIATGNTIFGGASALVIAKRLVRMGGTDLRHVVSGVYSASTGKAHPEYAAFKCLECGCAHLGQQAALECCQPKDDDENK